jgi:DNA-binding transcriptional LysR family regulator
MNFQQMRYFVAVADFGGFREAARQLSVSQPALSLSIRNLEEELGIILFDRESTGITLTVDGLDYYNQSVTFLKELNRFENNMSQKRKNEQKFTVASQHYDFLGPVISRLHQTFTDLKEIRITETTTQQVIEQVEKGLSEVGILVIHPNNEHHLSLICETKKLEIQKVKLFATHIVTRQNHPITEYARISEDDLHCYPQVRFFQDHEANSYFSEDLLEVFEDDRVIHTTDRSTMVSILQETDAFCSGSGLLGNAKVQGLVATQLHEKEENHIALITSKHYPLSERARLFINDLTQVLNENF